jgi:hypothetical protein
MKVATSIACTHWHGPVNGHASRRVARGPEMVTRGRRPGLPAVDARMSGCGGSVEVSEAACPHMPGEDLSHAHATAHSAPQ